MLGLHDVVKLNFDDDESGIPIGTEGTVIDILGNGSAYMVEFVKESGDFYEKLPIYTEDKLSLVWKNEQVYADI